MNKELLIIAGANGSGKSTYANKLLESYPDFLFINADDIAKEMNPQNIENVKVRAGKETISRIYQAFDRQSSFILESTISGNFIRKVMKIAKKEGYKLILLYLFVDDVDMCVDRVRIRALKGGHDIPIEDIVRRYQRSRRNFLKYASLVDEWKLFYNSTNGIVLVANNDLVFDRQMYEKFLEEI